MMAPRIIPLDVPIIYGTTQFENLNECCMGCHRVPQNDERGGGYLHRLGPGEAASQAVDEAMTRCYADTAPFDRAP
jgi:hypothetical protein